MFSIFTTLPRPPACYTCDLWRARLCWIVICGNDRRCVDCAPQEKSCVSHQTTSWINLQEPYPGGTTSTLWIMTKCCCEVVCWETPRGALEWSSLLVGFIILLLLFSSTSYFCLFLLLLFVVGLSVLLTLLSSLQKGCKPNWCRTVEGLNLKGPALTNSWTLWFCGWAVSHTFSFCIGQKILCIPAYQQKLYLINLNKCGLL